MSRDETFDVTEILGDLDAGALQQKLSRALQDAASGVIHYGDGNRKGKVTLEVTLSRIGESLQVQMGHKVKTDIPTKRGKVAEEDLTETVLYYTPKNRGLSVLPDNQQDFFSRQKDTANNG